MQLCRASLGVCVGWLIALVDQLVDVQSCVQRIARLLACPHRPQEDQSMQTGASIIHGCVVDQKALDFWKIFEEKRKLLETLNVPCNLQAPNHSCLPCVILLVTISPPSATYIRPDIQV